MTPVRRGVAGPRRLSRPVIQALAGTTYLKIRSGTEHRFTWLWVVVVNGRAYVRSWNDKPTGWFRAFLEEPRGEIEVGGRRVRIRALGRRGERLMKAIEQAYTAKYTTPASLKYVAGFRRPKRRLTTMELVPR